MSTRTNILAWRQAAWAKGEPKRDLSRLGTQAHPAAWKTEAGGQRTDDRGRQEYPSSVFRRPSFLLTLGLVVVGLAGCQQPQKRTPRIAVAEHTTTIEDLAQRLGLRIEERHDTFVILKNAANTVLIFTHADGRFFVNFQAIGPVGPIKREGGTLYVSDFLIPQIRQHLRSAVPQPPVVRPMPTPPHARGLVVIDAGHGGHDPGTISAGGLHEKDINLQVALKVATLLGQRGIGVLMTRQDDQFIELEERANIANRRNADLFVSIHSDSNPDRSRQGFTVFVARSASRDAYRAADEISQAMAATGCESHGIREADYKVLVNTSGPAVLVEMGYLSNAQDVSRLRNPAWQSRLAQAIATGILDYVR